MYPCVSAHENGVLVRQSDRRRSGCVRFGRLNAQNRAMESWKVLVRIFGILPQANLVSKESNSSGNDMGISGRRAQAVDRRLGLVLKDIVGRCKRESRTLILAINGTLDACSDEIIMKKVRDTY